MELDHLYRQFYNIAIELPFAFDGRSKKSSGGGTATTRKTVATSTGAVPPISSLLAPLAESSAGWNMWGNPLSVGPKRNWNGPKDETLFGKTWWITSDTDLYTTNTRDEVMANLSACTFTAPEAGGGPYRVFRATAPLRVARVTQAFLDEAGRVAGNRPAWTNAKLAEYGFAGMVDENAWGTDYLRFRTGIDPHTALTYVEERQGQYTPNYWITNPPDEERKDVLIFHAGQLLYSLRGERNIRDRTHSTYFFNPNTFPPGMAFHKYVLLEDIRVWAAPRRELQAAEQRVRLRGGNPADIDEYDAEFLKPLRWKRCRGLFSETLKALLIPRTMIPNMRYEGAGQQRNRNVEYEFSFAPVA